MTASPPLPPHFSLQPGVRAALRAGRPVVALESTVVTHGLPRPQNLELARSLEQIVAKNGACPATIAVLEGEIRIGLEESELERLAGLDGVRKVSRRDLASALQDRASGGTTVAGTLFAARAAGIRVFATGGIGGVHEPENLDISADLQALSDTPLVVVCAGAKAILDLPATLEYLETHSVPVVGYGTDEFPAFYSRSSGLPVSARVDSPRAAAELANLHWGLGLPSAILVCQPLPETLELPRHQVEGAIQTAREEARARGVRGPKLTPFLLGRLTELTGGRSLRANLDLLEANARLAAEIACALAETGRKFF